MEGIAKEEAVMESVAGRIPKMLPDRPVSTWGRVIHDMRVPNSGNHKARHPPAWQLRHRELIRKAIW